MYAATNVALVRELRRLGWSDQDVRAVWHAYELAMRLFTGQFRPTGNTFLAHLVATASILAAAGAPRPIVIAGLLHAAYTHGEFGDGRRGAAAGKRAAVNAVVGEESERLVHRYAEFGWRQVISSGPAGIAALSEADRATLLVRLANELEDHLDALEQAQSVVGLADSSAPEVAPRTPDGSTLRQCADAARLLGHDRLAVALDAAAVAHSENGSSRSLVARDGAGSFLLAPRSHRPRAVVALRYWLRGMRSARAARDLIRGLLAQR